MIRSQRSLAVALSKLVPLSSYSTLREQYPTPPDLASALLWHAHLRGDLLHKSVADLGCGHGILGYGAHLLGARLVYFVDADPAALAVAQKNFSAGHFFCRDVSAFTPSVDTVVMNPPFGVQSRHADRIFFQKAFSCARVIYVIHKITSRAFIAHLAREAGFVLELVDPQTLMLPSLQTFHTKQKYPVAVGFFVLRKL
jgi:putative methylase